MKTKLSILHAILWTAAIFASALLHGPLDLTLVLTLLAFTAVVASDEQGQRRKLHPTESAHAG